MLQTNIHSVLYVGYLVFRVQLNTSNISKRIRIYVYSVTKMSSFFGSDMSLWWC